MGFQSSSGSPGSVDECVYWHSVWTHRWLTVCGRSVFLLIFFFFSVKNGEQIKRYRGNPASEKMDTGTLLAEDRNKTLCLQCVWLHLPGLSLKSRSFVLLKNSWELGVWVPGASLYCIGHESKNKVLFVHQYFQLASVITEVTDLSTHLKIAASLGHFPFSQG